MNYEDYIKALMKQFQTADYKTPGVTEISESGRAITWHLGFFFSIRIILNHCEDVIFNRILN